VYAHTRAKHAAITKTKLQQRWFHVNVALMSYEVFYAHGFARKSIRWFYVISIVADDKQTTNNVGIPDGFLCAQPRQIHVICTVRRRYRNRSDVFRFTDISNEYNVENRSFHKIKKNNKINIIIFRRGRGACFPSRFRQRACAYDVYPKIGKDGRHVKQFTHTRSSCYLLTCYDN